MKLNAALLAVAVAFALAACKPADAPPAGAGDTAPPADTTTAPATDAPPADGAPTTDAPPADGAATNTGIAECDEYMTKVKACIVDKMPAEVREESLKAFEQTVSAWTAPGVDKASLAEGCKAALDAAKASYGAMGCTF